MSDNAQRAPCTVPPLVRKHILGTPALRPRALPGGGSDMVLIHGCRCAMGERRGPDGGVCGACGGAIPNVQISGGIPSAEADCSALRKRIAELEEGLRQIAVWKQEDQDDHKTCILQWRGCVAIARELLKPNRAICLQKHGE